MKFLEISLPYRLEMKFSFSDSKIKSTISKDNKRLVQILIARYMTDR